MHFYTSVNNQGKDGIERIAYDIIANELKMLGGNNPSSNDGSHAQSSSTPPPPQRQAQGKPVEAVEDIDDDIPF